MEDYVGKLDLVSDEELVNELSNRFDHIAFAGRKDVCTDSVETYRYWSGDKDISVGLCMAVIEKIREYNYEDEE